MKTVALITFLSFQYGLLAGESKRKMINPFYMYKSEVNSTYQAFKTTLTIHFSNPEFKTTPAYYRQKIYLSINGVLETIVLDSSYSKTWQLTSGKYVLKLWAGVGYNEIITDSISLPSQTDNFANAHFSEAYQEIMVDKPVVYFHSDAERDFNLNVTPSFPFSFTYPAIENGWNGRVHTDGTCSINGKNYPYLFWDSKQNYRFQSTGNGFKVDRENVISFLEDKLNEFGFNEREKTDFITYWGPRMSVQPSVFVQFLCNDACEQFAHLQCEPQPEQVQRIYITFAPWNSDFEKYLHNVTFSAPAASRFSILEWGGFEFETAIPPFIAQTL